MFGIPLRKVNTVSGRNPSAILHILDPHFGLRF